LSSLQMERKKKIEAIGKMCIHAVPSHSSRGQFIGMGENGRVRGKKVKKWHQGEAGKGSLAGGALY